MAKGSLLDAVSNAVKACKPPNWFDSLPKEKQSELLEIRRTWQGGGYPVKRLTLARILADECSKQGIHSCKEKRLSEWLQKS
jgi:hypothetical protein